MERRAALVLLFLLAGCERVDGPATTQTRGVDAFQSIEFRGAGTLDVLVGERQSLVVEGSETTLEGLATEVRNGKLVIESRGRFWERGGRLKVRATLPQLNALTLNGAGEISVTGLSGGATALVLSGAGNLEASGALEKMTAHVNGAGNLDLSRVTAGEAEAQVNGAGSIELNVTGHLTATVNGVGSITYAGKPAQVDTSINGVGSIRPAER